MQIILKDIENSMLEIFQGIGRESKVEMEFVKKFFCIKHCVKY